MMLGLAIHDIPLIRSLLPPLSAVPFATVLEPVGYAITARCGPGAAELASVVTGEWDASWELEAWSEAGRLFVGFPPSYVHAGSAVARLAAGGETREWRYPHNGYRAEWDNLDRVALGEEEPWLPLPEAVADLEFALSLAEGAGAACASGQG
jgi:hypothetical protein